MKATVLHLGITLLILFPGCSSSQSKLFPDGPGNNWEKDSEKGEDSSFENKSMINTESSFERQTANHYCGIAKGEDKFTGDRILIAMIYTSKDNTYKMYGKANQRQIALSVKLDSGTEFSSLQEFESFTEDLPSENFTEHPKVQEQVQKTSNLEGSFTQSACWQNTDTIPNSDLRAAIENSF
jgi:hypothetical protein